MKISVSGTLNFQTLDEKPRFIFSVKLPSGFIFEDIKMLALPNDHKVTASIQPVDAHGNPATIDGLAAWSSSNADIVWITNVSANSLSADLIPGATLGPAQINVTADADLGSGIQTITGLLDVQTVAGQAVGFTITTSPPVPLP